MTNGPIVGPAIKRYTQAEVDALVAAAVALVVQKACEVVKRESNFASFHAVVCEHILALADTNALAEHDAALREALKLQTEVFREQKAKLEAENAGLRSELSEMCRKAVINMEKANRFTYDDLLKEVTEARALLGEKP